VRLDLGDKEEFLPERYKLTRPSGHVVMINLTHVAVFSRRERVITLPEEPYTPPSAKATNAPKP